MSIGGHWQAELLPVFRDEAAERLDEIVACLLDLEAGHARDDVTDELFRHAHSLKGSAGMVGLVEAGDIAAALENILEHARREGPPAVEQVEELLRLTDALRRAIATEPEPSEQWALSAEPEATAAEPEATPPTRAEPVRGSATLKIPAEKIDRMLNAVGETVLHHRRLEHMMDGRLPAPRTSSSARWISASACCPNCRTRSSACEAFRCVRSRRPIRARSATQRRSMESRRTS